MNKINVNEDSLILCLQALNDFSDQTTKLLTDCSLKISNFISLVDESMQKKIEELKENLENLQKDTQETINHLNKTLNERKNVLDEYNNKKYISRKINS